MGMKNICGKIKRKSQKQLIRMNMAGVGEYLRDVCLSVVSTAIVYNNNLGAGIGEGTVKDKFNTATHKCYSTQWVKIERFMSFVGIQKVDPL